MDYHDTTNLHKYIKQSYEYIKDVNEARSHNFGYFQALYDFQIIEQPKYKSLEEYNEKLYDDKIKGGA